MTEEARNNWGVVEKSHTLFEGDPKECWDWMVHNFSDWTMKKFVNQSISIKRIGS